MTTKLTDEQVSTIEQALSDAGEIQPYSGRNMYGKRCLGIVTENATETMLILARSLMEMDERDTLDMLVDTWHRQDSMGRSSTVVYFPNLVWDDGETDEDDE